MPNARRLVSVLAGIGANLTALALVLTVAAPLARAAWPTMPTGRYRVKLVRFGDAVEAIPLTPRGRRATTGTITFATGWTDPDSAFRVIIAEWRRPKHAPLWDTLLVARATLPGYVGQCWVEHAQVPGVRRDSLTMQPRWTAPLLLACERGRDTVRVTGP